MTIVIGTIAILAVLIFLGSFLSSSVGPFTSSIIVETAITVIIVGASWGIHTKLLKTTIQHV